MGNCKYCGKPAGFLHRSHPACLEQHEQLERAIQSEQQQISVAIRQTIKGTGEFTDLEKTISDIDPSSLISSTDRQSLFIAGWQASADESLNDGPVSVADEQRLVAFQQYFGLTQLDLDTNGAYTSLAKSAILRDVVRGIIPQRCSLIGGALPNLQKGEQIVWGFPNSKYLQDKISRQFVGGSQGVSFRVVKGVYYHVGAFKGQAVEHTDRVLIDTGLAVLTNKNIYFTGSLTSLRLPYYKIVSFESFSNGIGFWKDATNAKAQYLQTGDGLFAYNFVMNLSKL